MLSTLMTIVKYQPGSNCFPKTKVEIHRTTVSMALPSKLTSEQKSDDSYLLFAFSCASSMLSVIHLFMFITQPLYLIQAVLKAADFLVC